MNTVTYYTDVKNTEYPFYFRVNGLEEHCNFRNSPELGVFIHALCSNRIFKFIEPATSLESNYTYSK